MATCQDTGPPGGLFRRVENYSFVSADRLGRYVRLNVGGSLFTTTVDTLTKRDSMLRAMFTGATPILQDSEGWVMLDRCGKHFGTILNYLRDGCVPLPVGEVECGELLAEASFYLLEDLAVPLRGRLDELREACVPICKVPIITSSEELQSIMAKNSQPLIRFLYNRSNNKYSYTGSSEENLLKNMELFDKMALCFQGRVLFVKDVAGQDICTWHFYGAGEKQAEVCCQSIVYAKDRKHNKIEFPEVRVYEEVLHIMLFENSSRSVDMATPKKTVARSCMIKQRKGLPEMQRSMTPPDTIDGPEASLGNSDNRPHVLAVPDVSGGLSSGTEGIGEGSEDDEISPCSEPYQVRMKRGNAQLSFNSKLPNVCRIPIVTMAGEFETIRRQTWRPIIRFVYNRSGNHFSYTSSSDEFFLKNVELFDRLSVCFQDRVLFVKDVVGNDVCSWYYYGQHKLRSEVSCQTIVYGSEKRQLKVDFPEARILEEAINIMLFEDHQLEVKHGRGAMERMAAMKRSLVNKRHLQSDESD